MLIDSVWCRVRVVALFSLCLTGVLVFVFLKSWLSFANRVVIGWLGAREVTATLVGRSPPESRDTVPSTRMVLCKLR